MKTAKQQVTLIDWMGSDLSVVNAARVSFAKESDWGVLGFDAAGEPVMDIGNLCEKDQKLISYLATHSHWSPFAHTSLQFRIKAPIFVARQLVKHQVGGVWNEVSRRYVDDEPEFYFPEVWRGKPVNAKQGSDGDSNWKDTAWVNEAVMSCLDLYLAMLNDGVAPEQARMILPQSMMTEWWWTGSLFFFARVCKLRLDPHAQKETQEIAQMINAAIPKEFEHSWKALVG
jgi:thymidylate synthase (FAD)